MTDLDLKISGDERHQRFLKRNVHLIGRESEPLELLDELRGMLGGVSP